MGLTDLLFRQFLPYIGAPGLDPLVHLVLDCTVNERHSAKARATRHPVEEGADISDHIHHEPDELTLEGVISNTPAIDPISLLTNMDPLRADTAYQVLLELVADGTPVRICTSLREYDNMVLESLEIPRSANQTNGVNFTLTARSIRTVSTKTVAATPKEERGKATKDRGRVATKAAPASSAAGGSAALQLLGGLF